MKFALIAAIVLATAMAFFATANSQQTQVTFLGWYFTAPLVIILLLTFGTGVLATLLAMIPGSVRKSMEISKLKSSVADHSAKLGVLEKKQMDKEPTHEKGMGHENNNREV